MVLKQLVVFADSDVSLRLETVADQAAISSNTVSPAPLRIRRSTIDRQHEIADILERFDTLCNDLSSGLPAEIEARQKQYEYYRDKLLSFREKAAE